MRNIDFLDLKNRLTYDYVKREDFTSLTRNYEKLNEYSQRLMNIDQVNKRIDEYDASMRATLKTYADREELQQMIQTFTSDLDTLKYRTNYANTQLKEIRKTSTTLVQQMESKANMEDIRKLNKRVDICVSLEHIKQVEQKILPKVEEFRGDLNGFREENKQHRNILLRFDEVMLEKASKFAIEQIYHHFNKYFSFGLFC